MEHQKKMARLSMIQTMPLFQYWRSDRLKQLNATMTEQKIEAGEIVFDIGGRADVMYIVNKGCISMECEVEVEDRNKCPTDTNTWEILKTRRLVMFELTKFREGQIFGHQELIDIINHDEEGNHESEIDYKNLFTRQTRAVAACATDIICVSFELFTKSKCSIIKN